jgi:hypothetical protein
MRGYVIKLEQPIEAETPELAAEAFREMLRGINPDMFYSPNIDVVQQMSEKEILFAEGDPEPIPMDIEVFQWWDYQQSKHLKPIVLHFDEAPEVIDLTGDETDDTDEETVGWYSRLSAPGYLDCTEWDGPHDTQYLAMESLYNMHGE